MFNILLGSDGFQNINKWKNYKVILNNYHIYIYNRPGYKVTETFGAQVTIMDAPLLELSSTKIRDMIKEKIHPVFGS